MFPKLPEHVPNRGHDIVIACVIGPIVTTIFILIRVWTRVFVTRNLAWDDFAAIATLPLCIAFSAVLGVATKYGFGLHLYDMTKELRIEHSKWIYISSAIYLPSILGYRLALLLLYLRMFGSNRPFRYATWAVMFFVTGYLSCNIITLFFGCRPISKYWKHDEPGHCLYLINADYAYGSMNVVSDVLMFLLPLPMVWQLRLPRNQKIGLSLVFMSGIINCIMTTVRFALVAQNVHKPDPAWLDARIFLFTVVEINTGLICGCTPVLKPFFRHFFSPSKSQPEPYKPPQMQPQQQVRPATTGSGGPAWMPIYPDDDVSLWNNRNFIELEGAMKDAGKRESRIVVREVAEQ